MAQIDDVKAACARLAPLGWQALLKQHGLDIAASDLAAELSRDLAIDLGIRGFEDFTLAGKRGIEPGRPAASLLYHAFASPNVHPQPTANRQPRPRPIRLLPSSMRSRIIFMANARSTRQISKMLSLACLHMSTGHGTARRIANTPISCSPARGSHVLVPANNLGTAQAADFAPIRPVSSV